MKMFDESLGLDDMFSSVLMCGGVSDYEIEGSTINDAGLSIVFSDSSHSLTFVSAPTIRECMLELADKWEQMAAKLRERAEKEINLVEPE